MESDEFRLPCDWQILTKPDRLKKKDNIIFIKICDQELVLKIEPHNNYSMLAYYAMQRIKSPVCTQYNCIVQNNNIGMILNKADSVAKNRPQDDIFYWNGLYDDIYGQLSELHKVGIVHGDVKFDNILEYNRYFALCDFEMCGAPETIKCVDNCKKSYDRLRYYVMIGQVSETNYGRSFNGDLMGLVVVFLMLYVKCDYVDAIKKYKYSGCVDFDIVQLCALRKHYIETYLLPVAPKSVSSLYNSLR